MTGPIQLQSSDNTNTQRLDINFAFQAAGLGVWEYDPVANRTTWDARCQQLFGLGTNLTYEQASAYIHPEDRERIDKAFRWAMNPASGGIYDETLRTKHADDGQLIWVRVVGKSQFNEAGEVLSLSGIAIDVTESKRLKTSEIQFRTLIESAPIGICVVDAVTLVAEKLNDRFVEVAGKPYDVILGNQYWDTFAEAAPYYKAALQEVIDTGITYRANETELMLIRHGKSEMIYVTFVYEPIKDETGKTRKVAIWVVENTDEVMTRLKTEESEKRFRNLIEVAPMAVAIFRGPRYIIELANDAHLQLWGRRADEVLNRPLFEAMPEASGQGFEEILDHVLATGEPFHAHELSAPLVRNSQMETVYFNFTYQPLREADGTITGIIVVANDITDQVNARRQVEGSEAKLRSLVDSAPFPIGVYVGREMRIQLANQSILDVWGKGNDVIGKLYSEILPELENQAIFDQLDTVYTTGIPFQAKNQRVDILVDGQLKPYYFNYNFTPLHDATGKVYGVMNTAAQVTDLVLAKQQVDESEATLRGAIELAELGTWSYDPVTGMSDFSDRLKSWFGFSPHEIITPDRGYLPIRPTDRHLVEQATQHAITPGTDGLYEVEFTIEASPTCQERIIHSVGRIQLDERGQPYKLVGTSQDVTQQRNLQLALERQVLERTEELAATNEELAVTNEELAANNEEYAAINEELVESTNLLVRSNENLQRFAYVASHDLQEPLRKIQQFGDLLNSRFGEQLGDGVDYLSRMQSAANRMSTLIRDLLDFSRIATQRDSSEAVPLTNVVQAVVADMDLTIQETGATVSISPLPSVVGDTSQLNQLFQNLISNALKFRRTDQFGAPVSPQVQVRADLIAASALPDTIRPGRIAPFYHRIDVIDDGIGFDERYLDRIFQVFQRLHGRNQYTGTGIGLAICEKVATNHGGAITASSQPGQGATFSVYLPV